MSAPAPTTVPLFCFEGVTLPTRGSAGEAHRGHAGALVSGPSVCVLAPELLENCIASTSIFVLPSYKEPTVDALASDTDEGRGWLRKATGSCRPSFDPWISEWGNPAPVMGCHSGPNTYGRQREPGELKHLSTPRKRKQLRLPE